MYEKLKPKVSDEFWNDINDIAKVVIAKKTFGDFWHLRDKYPDFIERCQNFGDNFVVPLHNKNIIKKNIKLEDKIFMYIRETVGYGAAKHLLSSMSEYPDFKTWFENATLTIYRGIPASYNFYEKETDPAKIAKYAKQLKEDDDRKIAENMQIEANRFKSYTLNLETAIKFTQPGWASRAWIDVKARRGWVFEGKIKPCDVHIFQNEGGEEECVIKGPFECTTYHNVANGKVTS